MRGGAGVPGDVISVVEFFFLWQKVLGTKLYAFRDGYSSFPQRLAGGGNPPTGTVESTGSIKTL